MFRGEVAPPQLILADPDDRFIAAGELPLYSYWVQQRYSSALLNGTALPSSYVASLLFVDMPQVNSPFSSNIEDNFFVNLSYSVRKKNLVNKTFATRLSNR